MDTVTQVLLVYELTEAFKLRGSSILLYITRGSKWTNMNDMQYAYTFKTVQGRGTVK